jgi:aspartate carbamoyltransferase catalytic subunit
MFSSYFDVVIMRSKIPQFAECCGYMMNDLRETSRRNIPVINGGAGADEHPTQALLDVYTIQRVFSFYHPRDSSQWKWIDELRETFPGLRTGIDGKVFCFCGDIRRGRTIRSLATLLSQYEDVSMYFVAPRNSKLSMTQEFRTRLLDHGVHVREFESLEDSVDGVPLIEKADCLYMTRIQREHNSAEDEEEFREIDFTNYRLSPGLVARMKPYAAVLHPFPRDADFGEIPITIDADPRAHYFRQARNGMWIRAALLAYLFDVDSTIADYYQDYTRETRDYNMSAL